MSFGAFGNGKRIFKREVVRAVIDFHAAKIAREGGRKNRVTTRPCSIVSRGNIVLRPRQREMCGLMDVAATILLNSMYSLITS
jgi:hypothetical protein